MIRRAESVFRIIRNFIHRYGPWNCFVSEQWLAAKMKCSVRTVQRCLKYLREDGAIEIRRRCQQTSCYNILRDFLSHQVSHQMSHHLKEEQVGTGVNKSGCATPRKPPAIAQRMREYVGDFRIGGKPADDRLVGKLAELVGDDEGFERFTMRLKAWCRRNNPESWGITLCLARDVAEARRAS
jgi:hypothetical protein